MSLFTARQSLSLAHKEVIMQYIGEFAAIGTSIAYAFGSTLFTLSGRTIGSGLVNRTRLLLALLLVIGWHWIWFGSPVPLNAGAEPIFWLAISGFIGFAIGDALLFKGFVILGPRLAMVIFSLNPAMGAILAWMFLGESLGWQEWAGILVTLLGIAIVVSEPKAKAKNEEKAKTDEPETEEKILSQREYIIGILFALGGALGQAVGQIYAKFGLVNGLEPLSANLIRLAAALVAIWLVAAFQGQITSSVKTLRANPKIMGLLLLAAIAGPVIGVWLNLVSIQYISIGVASTLGSLTPIFLIPISYFLFKEKVTAYAIVGTMVAFAGTAILFL
jgi:drug/metabolite transporter (DMT)-like permease